jgi:hypothetical protein
MRTISGKRIVEGCKLPSTGPITDDERAWIEILRIVYDDVVPAPNFDQVVQLREVDQRKHRCSS